MNGPAACYRLPVIVNWDGPESAEDRQRIERAVAAGVRRALMTASPAAPSPPDRPGGMFTGWGPDPERGMWVLPSYDGGGAPVAVPVQGSAGNVRTAPSGDPAAETETYTLAELQRGIRAAFPTTGGAPSPGIFYGIYGKKSGTDRPMLYYVPLGSGTLNSLFLYFRKEGQGKRLRIMEQAAALKLDAGFYTVTFQPHGRGMLIRNGEPLYRDMENPEDLDLTVAFVVDPLHVAHPQPPPWRFVPVTRIVAANTESPLATGAESIYSAYTEIWQVDESGVPQTINEFAFFLMSPRYRWEIYKLPHENAAEAEAELVREVEGYGERDIRYTWEKPGWYQVKCIVSVQGEDVADRPAIDWRKERVVERQLKMALQLELLERRQLEALEHPQGSHEQIWAGSGTELLEKFEAELRDEKAGPAPNQAKIDYLEEVIGKLRDQLFPTDRAQVPAFPIHAVFMDRKTSQTRPVSLFLAFEQRYDVDFVDGELVVKPYHWYLIDLTYPAFYRTYEGKGATALEALLAAFQDSETSFRRTYPPGQILARVTLADMTRQGIQVPPGFNGRDFTFETDSWQKDAYEWATLGLQVVGAIGLAAAFVFPPSTALATVLVLTGAAGAVLSVMNIADRIARYDFDWDVETFSDIASIAAAIAQVGALAAGARASALARVVATAEDLTPEIISGLNMATKVQRALLLTQLGTDVANGLILGYGTYEQLRMVDAEFDEQSLKDYQNVYGAEEGHQRWQQERENRITGILAHAVVGGTLIVVSVRSGVMGLGEQGKTSGPLRQLGAPGELAGQAPTQQGQLAGAPGPPPRWKGLKELEQAAATDPEAGQDLAWYRNATDNQLLAREPLGDPVATGLLNQRFGGIKRPYAPPRPLDPAIQQKLRSELARYRAAVEAERQRLRAEQQRLESEGKLKPEERDPRLAEAGPATWEIMKTSVGQQVVPPTGKQLRGYRGTIAVGVSDIPALQREVFEGASPMAFGSHDPAHPIRPPETITITKAHGHAEQSIGQQIHDRLAALTPEERAAASGKTVWIHVDQEVCSACGAGLGESERSGVALLLSELNPDIVFVITADDTSKVIRLRAGQQIP